MDKYKTDIFRVRLTHSERKALELMAHMEGCSISDLFRLLIREGADKRKFIPLGLLEAQEQKDLEDTLHWLEKLM